VLAAALVLTAVLLALAAHARTLRRLLPQGFEPAAVQSEEAGSPGRRWPLARVVGEGSGARGDDEWAEAV